MRLPAAFAVLLATLLPPCVVQARAAQSIPFEYRDGLIWIKATAGGAALNFLLDSGAGSSVLSLDAARRLGVTLGPPEKIQCVESATLAYRVPGFEVHVGAIAVKPAWLAMNLGSVSAACSRPIDGLLGQDFFRGRIVRIDFRRRRICLLEKAEEDAGRRASLPLKRLNDALCLPVAVNGAPPRWTRLDTGCDDGLHWVGGPARARGRTGASVGLSRFRGETLQTVIQLGNERVERVKTTLHAREIFPHEAGLLGNGVLSKFTVTIDARAGRVFLAKD